MLDWFKYLKRGGPVYSRTKVRPVNPACPHTEEAINKVFKLDIKFISSQSV